MTSKTKKSKILFNDVSYALEDNLPSKYFGVTIFDIDGDHEPEILVANASGNNIIYKYNEETGTFSNIAPNNFMLPHRNTICYSVGDFLGNGKPSVYMMHADAFSGMKQQCDNIIARTSKNCETLRFDNIVDEDSEYQNRYSGRSVAAFDYQGEGKHSFFVTNYQAPSLFFTYNTTINEVQELSRIFGLSQFASGRSVLAQYILNKRAIDILVGNEREANSYFTKTKSGLYFEAAHHFSLEDENNHSRAMAVADFDGNGLTDIVIGAWEGKNSILFQTPEGRFEDQSPPFFKLPKTIRCVIVADFDNDGQEEIFITAFNNRNRMYRYLGNKTWEEINIGSLALKDLNGSGAAIGDVTGNGFLDIFVTCGEGLPSTNKLFLGVPNGNHWLRIQPLTQHGFPALGAKVRLFLKNGKAQTKYICSGSGYMCQMEPVAHFGLGAEVPEIDRLEITWPGNGAEFPPIHIVPGDSISCDAFAQIPFPN
jgi:hypothetical protein